MNKYFIIFLSIFLTIPMFAVASDKAHWSYKGKSGPENWTKISVDNFACGGKNQSPVNLEGMIDVELQPVKFNYKANGNRVLNNGHTIQVNFQKGSEINFNNQHFDLKQLHYHVPSENHINGNSYPLETHLVHASKKGGLSVIAVMFKEGKENLAMKNIWKAIPTESNKTVKLKVNFNAMNLLPENKEYYRFNGSLTTPPCSDAVRWIVMKEINEVSKSQLNKLKNILGQTNNRPIQPTNARVLLQ